MVSSTTLYSRLNKHNSKQMNNKNKHNKNIFVDIINTIYIAQEGVGVRTREPPPDYATVLNLKIPWLKLKFKYLLTLKYYMT